MTPPLFAAATLTVTNPASSSVNITSGSAYSITWKSAGLSPQALVTITLQQAGQSGVYSTIATNITNSGLYSWVVPVLLPVGSYYILISTVNLSPSVVGAGPAVGTFKLFGGSLLSFLYLVFNCDGHLLILFQHARRIWRAIMICFAMATDNVLLVHLAMLLRFIPRTNLTILSLALTAATPQEVCTFLSFEYRISFPILIVIRFQQRSFSQTRCR